MNRRSSALLFILVFALASGDWFLERTTAQPGDGRSGDLDAAAPAIIPASARLTGATARKARIDGVDVTLEGGPDNGFVLVFHNPEREQRVSDLQVDCVQADGTIIGRMGPIVRVTHSEHVVVRLPPGATVRRTLEAEVAPAPSTINGPNAFALFSATSFRLRHPGADGTVLGVLRGTNTPSADASPLLPVGSPAEES